MSSTTEAIPERRKVTATSLLATALQAALDRLLAMDPEVAGRFENLAGRPLAIEVRGLDLTLFLIPRGDRLQVVDRIDTEPAATLRASPLELATQMGRDEWLQSMELRGDVGYARQFHGIFRALEFDWEEHISRIVGDVAARKIGNLARGSLSWGSQVVASLSRATADYLQEESRDLPAPTEIERFLAEVDRLRADSDRLAARIERLERLASERAASGKA